ncbi:hypothetical protein AB0C52_28775 [Streptomyces sp. NPDC048717]|uniref:hypothetical protein n=1 Tax=unclassified Streptomyces TaxID=2593676 RepID=UPI00343B53BB
MIALLILLGVFAACAALLISVLLRRTDKPTENADGLLAEQAARERAHMDRSNFSTMAVHSNLPTMTDHHHRRR